MDIGGVRILYVPPPPVDPLKSLAPPGLESTKGVLSITFRADDGELLSDSNATSTITVIAKPRASDVVIVVPSLVPKNLSGRVPDTATEYYDGVFPAPTRVPLWPTNVTFVACGDQTLEKRDRLHSMLYSLPSAGTGTLFALRSPDTGWYDANGDVVNPPIKGEPYQSEFGSGSQQQVNPAYAAQAKIDNPLRQILYEPIPVTHDDPVGYNATFLYRVCVVEPSTNSCGEYSDFAKVTMVVRRQNQPPTATPPTLTVLREALDAVHGVTLTLTGLDVEDGADVAPAVVRPPGAAGSCGDGSSSCGTLYQVNSATGERGEAFSPSDCTRASPCFVTDLHRRVVYVPDANGRDLSGPSGAAYCTLQFAVSDGDLFSVPADVTIRVNAAPTVPATIRRVFVDEDSSGVLPLPLLATDTDGDELTFFFTAMTGSTLRPEFFDVDGYHDPSTARRGAALSASDVPQALTPGSDRVWFRPRPNATGNLTGCCPTRTCVGDSGDFTVRSTCAECAACEVGRGCGRPTMVLSRHHHFPLASVHIFFIFLFFFQSRLRPQASSLKPQASSLDHVTFQSPTSLKTRFLF